METYKEGGRAEFYCPTLYNDIYKKRHWEDIEPDEKFLPEVATVVDVKGAVTKAGRAKHSVVDPMFDGQRHSTWVFSWDAGAYHINHPNNGGIPKCKECNKTLMLVAGDDPS